MMAGVMSPRTEDTPKGEPLSLLLSNILLTGLDRELERRGQYFCRYADDCNIYVRSLAAGEGVPYLITVIFGAFRAGIGEVSCFKLRDAAKDAIAAPIQFWDWGYLRPIRDLTGRFPL